MAAVIRGASGRGQATISASASCASAPPGSATSTARCCSISAYTRSVASAMTGSSK